MLLTIFTPIYNREKYIPNLFDSINNQINKNFEWIIIDDGSTDDTKKVIQELLNKNKVDFPIKFLSIQNGGKQRAINKAVKIAKGEFFFIVDSDDLLIKNTTDLLEKWIDSLKNKKEYNEYAGVSGLKQSQKGNLLSGNGNGKEVIICTNLERRRYNLVGDLAEAYKTSLLRANPFPEFKNENFITEEVVWNKIAAEGYKLEIHMTPIYIAEYLSDGLTKNAFKIAQKNFKGLTYVTKQDLKLKGLRDRLGNLRYFTKVGLSKGLTIKKLSKLVNVSVVKVYLNYYLGNLVKKVIGKKD